MPVKWGCSVCYCSCIAFCCLHVVYSVYVYTSHSYSHCLNPICFVLCVCWLKICCHLLHSSLSSHPSFLSSSFLFSPMPCHNVFVFVCVCVCVCVRVCVCVCRWVGGCVGVGEYSIMQTPWKPGGIKSSQGFAVVLVGLWSPLSHDQMGLGRSGTRPQALDNSASPAMCEHLFSSIKTVIWIFQSHCLMTALSDACMKSKERSISSSEVPSWGMGWPRRRNNDQNCF